MPVSPFVDVLLRVDDDRDIGHSRGRAGRQENQPEQVEWTLGSVCWVAVKRSHGKDKKPH